MRSIEYKVASRYKRTSRTKQHLRRVKIFKYLIIFESDSFICSDSYGLQHSTSDFLNQHILRVRNNLCNNKNKKTLNLQKYDQRHQNRIRIRYNSLKLNI